MIFLYYFLHTEREEISNWLLTTQGELPIAP